ncbi:SGNH/GDSL hydrolase family protein [uncultured Algibacter sp.]|jgi:lysophospholipase L1-like esterase|uniref:SGNH/GDSL hydrolase family protein n=1 Tax=uncultured Algibacter sp. TaxID=298659 RepID=UPI0026353DBB|nr:SGNH/GDSL hydrolase family protein [uncultured Algibacter sp.]
MKFKLTLLCFSLSILLSFGCSENSEYDIQDEETEIVNESEETEKEETGEGTNNETSNGNTLKILSLGDSYTIGQSVCETCRFPEQLKESLKRRVESTSNIQLNIIARTGWTTSNLKNAIVTQNPANDQDLVTLLIGVNNEYQNRPFSIYETEFPQLVNTAIQKAKGDKNKVIVISIPDYAYTPFGKGNSAISQRLDRYNDFARDYCSNNNISYVFITDITRQGLNRPELVASDGLHPSALAYTKFVERILPVALGKL